ncbi:MAG: sugar ABC transporter permease [Polyangiaceae bacterium]|nr:sugar ABC transporter permease [Polyangiaceae bacterium]
MSTNAEIHAETERMAKAGNKTKQPSQAQPALPRRELSMLLALGFLWALFALKEPAFLSARNLSLLTIELSVTAILALGMLLVLLPGQIDLAAGSGVGLFGAIAAVLVFSHGVSAPLALALSLFLGVLVWAGVGWLIVRQRIVAFIVTLGGLLVFKGLHWLTIQNQTVPVAPGGESNLYSSLTTFYLPPWPSAGVALVLFAIFTGMVLRSRRRRQALGFQILDGEVLFLGLFVAAQVLAVLVLVANKYRGIPLSVLILVAVAWGVWLLTSRTPFGRHLYAVGGNLDAARLSGVNVSRVVIVAYALMGGAVALTGFLQTAYSGASTSTVGQLMELDAIAACVIGGTSLKGGRGNVMGVLFGALIMASLLNGLTLMAVSPEVKFIARGLVLTLAVWFDGRMKAGR